MCVCVREREKDRQGGRERKELGENGAGEKHVYLIHNYHDFIVNYREK